MAEGGRISLSLPFDAWSSRSRTNSAGSGAGTSHYTVSTSGTGLPGTWTGSQNAVVVSSAFPIAPDGDWLAQGPSSKWVSLNSGASAAVGYYKFTTTIDLMAPSTRPRSG